MPRPGRQRLSFGPSAASAKPGGLNWAKRQFAGQRVTFRSRGEKSPVHPGVCDRPLEAAPPGDINRRRRLLYLRAIPAVAGHGYCASRRALLRAKGSTPSSRAAPGTTSMTRIMLIMLMSRCRPAPPRESAYSMSAPTAGPAIAT